MKIKTLKNLEHNATCLGQNGPRLSLKSIFLLELNLMGQIWVQPDQIWVQLDPIRPNLGPIKPNQTKSGSRPNRTKSAVKIKGKKKKLKLE